MKSMRFKSLILISAYFLFLHYASWHSASWAAPATMSGTEFTFKVSVESRLEERLRAALTDIIGNNKAIIIINADVGKTREEAPIAESEGIKDDLILPGVPPKKMFSTEKIPALPSSVQGMIRRLSVTILLDNSVSDDMKETIKDVAMSVIGYNPGRGDQMEVKKMSFGRNAFQWKSLFYPPHLYWVVLVVFVGFFLVTAAFFMMFLMNPFKKLSAALSVNLGVMRGPIPGSQPSEGQANPAVQGMPDPSGLAWGNRPERGYPMLAKTDQLEYQRLHEENGSNGRESGIPFSFIKERHLQDLAFLLKDGDALDTAIVINYMDAELATQLLYFFSDERQAEIAVKLSAIEEVSPDKVKELEEMLKSRLDYVMGGEDKVASILGMASDEVRDRVFGMLESKDSDTAMRLKQKVKSLDTVIGDMSPRSVQALYRQIDPSLFAQVLRSSPEDIQQKVLGSLTEGAADRLRQEIDLSRPLTANRLRRERYNIMTTIRRMAESGMLEEEME